MHGSILYKNSSKRKYIFIFGGRIIDNISNEVFTEFHSFIVAKENKDEVVLKMHEISIQYNIDKKTFLLKYFNYIIRNNNVSVEYLNRIENIIHNTNDVPIDVVIRYFFE
jgi:hypothetical protein